MNCHEVLFWQTRLQKITQFVMKCCLNHLRKKYGVLQNNGSAGKKYLVYSTARENVQSRLTQFLKICLNLFLLRLLTPNLNLLNNFKPKIWWIWYIKSGVVLPSLSKGFLNFSKKFFLRNCKSRLFHSRMV